MTAGGRYLSGFLAVATVGLATVFIVSADVRREVAWGIGVALLVQAPLGWWTVRSVGTDRFQLVWVLGMVIRMALVAIAGLYLIPELRWELVAALGALVATMLVMLVVEVAAVLGNTQRSRHNDL